MLLDRMAGARNALLLGDGDGRFAARLLQVAPSVHITAVDSSSAMLHALQARCGCPDRVTALCLDLAKEPGMLGMARCYDLVTSHFFLDCLDQSQLERLVREIKPMLAPQARWIVSEFQIPRGPMRLPAYLLVRSLYVAFGLLAGLKAKRLPAYRQVLEANGFTSTARQYLLCGVLVAEEWRPRKAD